MTAADNLRTKKLQGPHYLLQIKKIFLLSFLAIFPFPKFS